MDADPAPERSADDVDLVESHGVEHGGDVGGHEVVGVGVGRRRLAGAAMAPQIDGQRAELAARRQPAGDRFEQPGAEPVGMQEDHRPARPVPVEPGDAQAVVLDGDSSQVRRARLGATRGGSPGCLG